MNPLLKRLSPLLVLLAFVNAATHGDPFYIFDGGAIRRVEDDRDADKLQVKEWQIWLYRNGETANGTRSFWGLIDGKSRSQVLEKLRRSQEDQKHWAKGLGYDYRTEKYTNFNPLGPIAVIESSGRRSSETGVEKELVFPGPRKTKLPPSSKSNTSQDPNEVTGTSTQIPAFSNSPERERIRLQLRKESDERTDPGMPDPTSERIGILKQYQQRQREAEDATARGLKNSQESIKNIFEGAGRRRKDSTSTECPSCNGSGKISCTACFGSGVIVAFPKNQQCSVCNGTGKVTCFICSGTGKAPNF